MTIKNTNVRLTGSRWDEYFGSKRLVTVPATRVPGGGWEAGYFGDTYVGSIYPHGMYAGKELPGYDTLITLVGPAWETAVSEVSLVGRTVLAKPSSGGNYLFPHPTQGGVDLFANNEGRWTYELVEVDDPEEGEVSEDVVNHPAHYTSHPSGVECIEITRHHNFNVGNAMKYLWRAGLKVLGTGTRKEKQIEDLNKAVFYIQDEIKRLEGESDSE